MQARVSGQIGLWHQAIVKAGIEAQVASRVRPVKLNDIRIRAPFSASIYNGF
jgi:hypothetical protein